MFGKFGDKSLDPTRYELQLVKKKVDIFKKMSEVAVENVSGACEGVKEIAEGAVEVVFGIGEIIDGIANIFGKLAQNFDFTSKGVADGDVGRGVKEIAKGAVEISKGIGDLVNGIRDLFGGFADKTLEPARYRLQLIKKKLEGLTGVKEIAGGTVKVVLEYEDGEEVVSGLSDEVVSGFGDDDGIKDIFEEFEKGRAARGEIAEGAVEVVAGVGEIVDGIKALFGKFPDKILEQSSYSLQLLEKRKRMSAIEVKNSLGPYFPLPCSTSFSNPVNSKNDPKIMLMPGPVIPTRPMMTYELMKFSGYYKMKHGPDAFFTVDSNMLVIKKVPTYDVSLVVSMDGITSTRYAFTGTFDGVHLRQISYDVMGESFCLTFERHDGKHGIVASFSGTISEDGGDPIPVAGSTYDNPVPYSTFVGTYYEEVQPVGSVPVLYIKADCGIMFINGCLLFPIEDFVYNFNGFSFTYFAFGAFGRVIVRNMIMGTDSAKGLVCTELTTVLLKGSVETSQRTFVTIPHPEIVSSKSENDNVLELAKFAGYYQLPSMGTGAFVSIMAQHLFLSTGSECEVFIGISRNGITSKQYKFDKVMTFTNGNRLTMPNEGIEFEFTRAYNAHGIGDLVTLKGSFKHFKNVFGYTCFNPVPLTAFGGVPLTNRKDNVLDIKSDNEVIYNGFELSDICYNPLTRVAFYPSPPASMISFYFGTFGTVGVAAIVTGLHLKPPKFSYLFAIPPRNT